MEKLSRDETWLLREKYDGVRGADFEQDRQRLSRGEPLAYVIGSIPFLNTTIHLDSRPLIPRPETEYWAELVIEQFSNRASLSVLDLCAGSGCLGIAIAKNISGAAVDFIEIDERHHKTIQRNVLENGIPIDHIRIFGGNLFEYAPHRYDLIVSNPPYIGTDAADEVDASVISYEPEGALFAGKDGLRYLRRIIAEAPAHLLAHGDLFLEHEPRHENAIAALAHQNGFRNRESIKDQYGIVRVTHLSLSKK